MAPFNSPFLHIQMVWAKNVAHRMNLRVQKGGSGLVALVLAVCVWYYSMVLAARFAARLY